MINTLIISTGAALGANARYWLGVWAEGYFAGSYPIGTILINVSGSFLMGIIGAFIVAGPTIFSSASMNLLLVVGFLGSYTTFSAFENDALKLILAAESSAAIVYILASVIVGFIALYTGLILGRRFFI